VTSRHIARRRPIGTQSRKSARSKHLSLGKRGCPENPSAVKTAPSLNKPLARGFTLENDHDALSLPKGNAVKDQHRNDKQPTPCLFQSLKVKRPLPSAAFKLNFFFLSTQKVAEAKNLISQDGRTTRRDAYQSQQGMMRNEARKNETTKN